MQKTQIQRVSGTLNWDQFSRVLHFSNVNVWRFLPPPLFHTDDGDDNVDGDDDDVDDLHEGSVDLCCHLTAPLGVVGSHCDWPAASAAGGPSGRGHRDASG